MDCSVSRDKGSQGVATTSPNGVLSVTTAGAHGAPVDFGPHPDPARRLIRGVDAEALDRAE